MTGGFASLMPKDEDVAHAIEVLHEMEGTFRDRNLELRHEPELGWPEGYRPRRPRKH